MIDSSPSSAESSFRELDEVFLQVPFALTQQSHTLVYCYLNFRNCSLDGKFGTTRFCLTFDIGSMGSDSNKNMAWRTSQHKIG